ncbi:uncharacterized protein LOC118496498 [Sander lucioperca]|uniref:uncharacterized protein LOC118496498 n=1 Tax=Sander lucioperca TaxID=283035 RepID=UPI0016537D37|nr:uncharacterized protein LOC118496498 [Sander lucioperca]
MAAFELSMFVSDPTSSKFDKCTKKDLREIAEYYGISVSVSLRKAELKAFVFPGLVSQGVFSLSAPASSLDLEVSAPDVTDQPVTPVVRHEGAERQPVTLLQFEPMSVDSSSGSKLDARLKVRLLRLQVDWEEKERDFQLRRELELKKLEVETALKMHQMEIQVGLGVARSITTAGAHSPSSVSFDVSKHISLVPFFRESEVEAYFGAFERIAAALQWPKDVWAILLQCKLVGKAQGACSSLSVEDGLTYDKVKGAILQAYELVPEAYRQRFRGLRKAQSQSYVDFAREKGILFDRWCAACKVADMSSLRELMLLEEFKNCIPERTTVYLNEQFTLTHKAVFNKRDTSPREAPQKSDLSVRYDSAPSRPRSDKLCFFCRKSGHLVANCDAWKRKQQGSFQKPPKGVGLIKTFPRVQSLESLTPEVPDDCFKPFIFNGFVSLSGKSEDQRPVRIPRDTACSQSLILSDVLPLGLSSSVSAVVRGIEMGFVPAPLYQIHVQSCLVTGFFTVGARSGFPVDGVDFIMGNDIAGGKVRPVPEVVCTPIPKSESDELAIKHPHVFVASVNTRAQGCKQAREVNLSDLSCFCKTCSSCQMVGKPNQPVPLAPLRPVPAVGELFEHVLVDCVGPLPTAKSGNQFSGCVVLWFLLGGMLSATMPFNSKSLLCSAPVLAAPDIAQPFQLEVDTSAT